MNISRVKPDSVGHVWPHVLPMIERGIAHVGEHEAPDDIRHGIMDGSFILWAVHEGDDILAIVVLQIIERRGKRSLVVVMLAGREMASWVDQVEQLLIEYRDLIGAHDIRSCSRVGMGKILKARGWKVRALMMEGPR